MIEPLENFNMPDIDHCNIQIKTGTSYANLELVINNLPVIGEIQKVVHYRKRKEAEYLTIITGVKHNIAVIGGLTSGYQGTGPNASIELLKQIGFEERHVETLYYDPTYENALITLEK
ncbi:MAG: hypothetical protein ACQEWW_26485 [Bacillota bacterium]